MRTTHTSAILDLSPAAYDEIADKLRAAGYGHAFIPSVRHGETIDMHGIAVARADEEPQTGGEPEGELS